MTRLRSLRPATLAALLVTWAVAWSAPSGQLTWDTKYDLLVNPWGLLRRALHLWDPQVTWGGLSNQGHGYLFPMGPFFALGSEIAPMWVVQRLWWMLLLTLGFVGALGLLRALQVGSPNARLVGALAWVLAPKAVMSVGLLSAEVQPQLLVPLILWPVVLGWRGRLTPVRAAALSGVAILLCGGVNASATLLALVPTGLFLSTRPGWWRQRLTWLWLAAAALGTAWWLGPLLMMSRFAPPFLDWIETAQAVSAPITLLDVVRGTTHWLGHLLTPGGPWWPAGYQLSTWSVLIVLTAAVAALGLGGLTLRSMPVRGYCWLLLAVGVVALSLPHTGPLSSPVEGVAQSLLDGALAPFRNIHKVDAFVRLPLVLGLVHLLGVRQRAETPAWRRTAPWLRQGAVGAAAVLVVLAAAPAFTGAAVARGAHPEPAQHWVELGAWLDEQADGAAAVVPAASFGEYTWGRTIDEPLRGLTEAPYVVRDAVPIAPAGAIRLLDDLEVRLQTGRSLGGAPEVLRRAGVRYLVLRNDLATQESGQPPVVLARSAIRLTPGVRYAEGFGSVFEDATGQEVHPIEVYRLDGDVAGAFTHLRLEDLVRANGSADDLVSLTDAGVGRTVVFDGDRTPEVTGLPHVRTDGVRARNRFFGAPRGEDATATLTTGEVAGTRDYRPWSGEEYLSTMVHDGITAVTASSSFAFDYGFAGLAPAMRPAAALDADPRSGWLTMWDAQPTLTIGLARPLSVEHLVITPFTDPTRSPGRLQAASRVRISTDSGVVDADLDRGATPVPIPSGPTRTITIEITDTRGGDPGDGVTGLAEVEIPGLTVGEVLMLPAVPDSAQVSALVLDAGLPGRDGCLVDEVGLRCLGGETIDPEVVGTAGFGIPGSTAGDWLLAGTMRPVDPVSALAGSPDVTVNASSARSNAPGAAPASIVDGDDRTSWSPSAGDRQPELTFDFARPTRIQHVRFDTRGTWLERARPVVRVEAGAVALTQRLAADGVLDLPATTTERLRVTFIAVPGPGAPALAGMELVEVDFRGAAIAGPPEDLAVGCGAGPVVTVNGEQIRTRAQATREGWLGVGTLDWQACDPIALTGSIDTITVAAWEGLAPARTVAVRDADVLTTRSAVSLDGVWSGNRATFALAPADEARVLALTQNASAGWAAELDGARLEPITLDGHRQGFVVPPRAAGTVQVGFTPDRSYRILLLLGLILAAALPAAALVARRSPEPAEGSADVAESDEVSEPAHALAGLGRRLGRLVAVGLGLLVAGPVGGLTALAAVLLAGRLRDQIRATVAMGLVVLGALAAAVIAPDSTGPAWLEGSIRVLLVAALVLAATTHQPGRQPGRRNLDEAMTEGTEEQADRQSER